MSEGWEDCPVLPVGWKRREVFRRSGATIGKSDTYYMSPTAERFRSKVELVKYFGDSLDLTYFDFKKGIILPPHTKIRKSVKRSSTSSCDREEDDWQPTPKKKVKVTASPSPIEVSVAKASATEGLASDPLDTLIACCEDCQQWVPGVMFGAQKRRFKFYCAECRARRRELGRKLNYYKRFGCGECEGCVLVGDCGVCRGCLVRNSEPTKNWKCVKRRCQKLKEIKAESSCRNTTGKPKRKIKTQPIIKAEVVAEEKPVKKVKSPFQELKKAMKKVKSESQVVEKKPPRKIKTQPIIKAEVVAEEKPVQKPCPPVEEEEVQEPPIQLFTPVPIFVSEDFVHYYNVNSEFLLKSSRTRRNNRSCGECEACLRPMDCGACDFCKDKAKFGGCNTLRQKCRWKQCLQFASKRLLPRELLGGQSPWSHWKEQGYRSGRRHWKENIFASRKVARVIQVARKRKIWQASAQAPEVETVGEEEPSESADWADPTRAETLEAAESSQARTESPQRSVDTAEDKVVIPGTPEKPFLIAPESHDRPSVIKETSSEQTRRQPVEVPPTMVKRDTPETDPESIPTPRSISETEAAPHRSVSPIIKQRDSRERHSSRKALLLSSQEAEAKDLSTRIVPPLIQEGAAEPASANRPPASPKRAAEPEIRASGVPSNSRIIGGATPEQNPGYGRSTPAAITQIFSLGSPYMMMTLEPLLRNFMQELMVMPLPASWVVCSSLGPDVQLIQLSRKSPVSDAVVQIRPGFFFHVLVRGLPVPLGHRLYRSHPAQLTTVDDVVDLISDLETYRVCAGYPQLRNAKPPPAAVAALLPRERSSYCEVLVDKDRCFQCAITL